MPYICSHLIVEGGSSGCLLLPIGAGEPIAPLHLTFAKGVSATFPPAFAQAYEENEEVEMRFELPSPP